MAVYFSYNPHPPDAICAPIAYGADPSTRLYSDTMTDEILRQYGGTPAGAARRLYGTDLPVTHAFDATAVKPAPTQGHFLFLSAERFPGSVRYPIDFEMENV